MHGKTSKYGDYFRNAEAFLNLHREIVLTMKAGFVLRVYLTTEAARKSAMKNKKTIRSG